MKQAADWSGRSLFFPIMPLFALMLGCGSGIVSGVVHSGTGLAPECSSHYCFCDTHARILTTPPKEAYDVVGLIEVRTSRPKAVDVLLKELKDRGKELCADAVMPGDRHDATQVAAGAGQYRPFYVHDDGRTQVLEAKAIRYK